MTGMGEAMDAITAALSAAGIRAVVDERDVNPPCAWLREPALSYRFNKGGWDASWRLLAVVPDSGRRVAIDQLADLVAQCQEALAGAVVAAEPVDVPTGAGAVLPGYQLTWSDRIRI